MLWEYKRKFAKDPKFETAVQERFCVADLKLVIVVTMFKSYYHPLIILTKNKYMDLGHPKSGAPVARLG